MRFTKILAVGACAVFGFAAIVSFTAEKSNKKYGQMVAVSALYEEQATQPRYDKVSYEEIQNLRFDSDQRAKVELDGLRADEKIVGASESEEMKARRNKEALRSITSAGDESIREKSEKRLQEYTVSDLEKIDTLDDKNDTISVPIQGAQKNLEVEYLGPFIITAYCPCKDCCGKTDGITASGKKAVANHTIAADPSVLPIGTEVLIDGQVYTVEDTGSAIKSNHIDIYFDSHEDATNYGKREKDVYKVLGEKEE